MILKLLLVIAVIGIVYFIFIKKKPSVTQKAAKNTNKKDDIKADDMIECSTCGVYSEVSESLLSNAKYYCSKECVDEAS
ncbi:hypothetical protein JHD49_00310 [Sulfurimonas sp. SAG-AH-194-C21]|nr:PP0621 family protein [Sulfurimonas sp. SAG-AH-194-C21]MDF1882378.1 hypothetical protein [Sulfurimonas sp. SAG-AH-194-C21]